MGGGERSLKDSFLSFSSFPIGFFESWKFLAELSEGRKVCLPFFAPS